MFLKFVYQIKMSEYYFILRWQKREDGKMNSVCIIDMKFNAYGVFSGHDWVLSCVKICYPKDTETIIHRKFYCNENVYKKCCSLLKENQGKFFALNLSYTSILNHLKILYHNYQYVTLNDQPVTFNTFIYYFLKECGFSIKKIDKTNSDKLYNSINKYCSRL